MQMSLGVLRFLFATYLIEIK